MPKLKTRKAASKRFRATGTGKIVRRKPGEKQIHHYQIARLVKLKDMQLVNYPF